MKIENFEGYRYCIHRDGKWGVAMHRGNGDWPVWTPRAMCDIRGQANGANEERPMDIVRVLDAVPEPEIPPEPVIDGPGVYEDAAMAPQIRLKDFGGCDVIQLTDYITGQARGYRTDGTPMGNYPPIVRKTHKLVPVDQAIDSDNGNSEEGKAK